MTNNIMNRGDANHNALTVVFDCNGSEVKLSPQIVAQFLTGGANISLPEFKFFTELCKVRKLNPFLKEAYIIKYSDRQPAQIVVSKEVIIKRAVLHPDFDGRSQGIIVENNETGEIFEKNGTFYVPTKEKLVGAWAKVYRKNWKYPVYTTVRFDEVAAKKSDGSLNSQWSQKGATMVEKVALVRALREAFIEDLGSMYDESETGGIARVGEEPIKIEPELVDSEAQDAESENVEDLFDDQTRMA
jgi:phage recombination protein Bet